MKPEETIDFHIRWAWHQISKAYNVEAARHDTTMSVGYALLNIDMEEGTPSTSLGPKMGMENTSLTRLLKSMEEKGLIYRKNDMRDRRIVRIFLTDLGKEKREISKKTVLYFNETIQQQIPQKKLNVFFEVIQQINTILEKQEIFKHAKNN